MKFYVATGIERFEAAKAAAEELTKLGHELTYAWWSHGSVQDKGPERIREVGEAETDAVRAAELVVVLLPGGRGTHTEFGIALASKLSQNGYNERRKTIVLVGPTEDDTGRTCSFYLHSAVTDRFATVPEMMAWLRGWARSDYR